MSLVHRKGRQSGRAALLRGVLDDVEDLQRDLGRGKAANNAHRASEARLAQLEARVSQLQGDTQRRLEHLAGILECLLERSAPAEAGFECSDGAAHGPATPRAAQLPPPSLSDTSQPAGGGCALSRTQLVRLFQICQYCSLEEAVVAILGSGGPFVAGLEFSRGAGVRDIPLQPAVVLAWVDRFLRPDAARELRDAAAKVTRRLRDVRARTMKAVKTAALRWEMPNSRGEFGTVFEPRESLRDGSLEVCVRSDMPLTTATFSALVLHDDASLNLDEGSLLLCLVRAYAGALADADPQAGSPHDTPGTKITPGGLASLLIEAENMCLPPSMPSMARSLPAYHKRRTVLFNRHVRPLLGTPRGDSVFLPERVVAAWLPGVGPLPTWAQKTSWGGVPGDVRARCAVRGQGAHGPDERGSRAQTGHAPAGPHSPGAPRVLVGRDGDPPARKRRRGGSEERRGAATEVAAGKRARGGECGEAPASLAVSDVSQTGCGQATATVLGAAADDGPAARVPGVSDGGTPGACGATLRTWLRCAAEGGGSSGAGKRSSLPTEIDGVDALVQF